MFMMTMLMTMGSFTFLPSLNLFVAQLRPEGCRDEEVYKPFDFYYSSLLFLHIGLALAGKSKTNRAFWACAGEVVVV